MITGSNSASVVYAPPPSGDALGELYCRAAKEVTVDACPPSDTGEWQWARCAAREQFDECLYARSVELYRLAIDRCEPQRSGTHRELAGLYTGFAASLSARGRDAEAAVALRRAIELRPDWTGFWAALGATLERLDRRDEACEAHRRALELDPENGQASGVWSRSVADVVSDKRVGIRALRQASSAVV